MTNKTCSLLCSKKYEKGSLDDTRKLMLLKKGMSLNYQHHWIIDNMPITWCYTVESDRQYCSIGFPMGCYSRRTGSAFNCGFSESYTKPNTYFLINHVDLFITYHSGKKEDWGMAFQENGGRIISVKVQPRSILHTK